MFTRICAYAFVALLVLTAMDGCASDMGTSDQDILVLYHDDLLALLSDEKRPVVLVDVRSPEKYAQGHIPGAINIPLPELAAGEPRFAEAYHIVVYARNWRDNLSPAAAKKMLALGYRNVHDYRDGLDRWRDEGGQVATLDQAANE